MVPQVELFLSVLWKKIEEPKRHFEINWPLACHFLLLELLTSKSPVHVSFQWGIWGYIELVNHSGYEVTCKCNHTWLKIGKKMHIKLHSVIL